MFAVLMISPKRLKSSAISRENSSGVDTSGTEPQPVILAVISGNMTMREISTASLSITGFGVRAGSEGWVTSTLGLAVTGTQRVPTAPDLPTAREAGLADCDYTT